MSSAAYRQLKRFDTSLEIVLQVFHRLLKAHAAEARNVVRQALAILTPAVPTRMDDGNVRKILNC